MKWNRVLVIWLLALIVLVVVRGVMHFPLDEAVFIDLEQPFYIVYFVAPEFDYLVPEFHQGEATIEQLLAALLNGPRQPDLVSVLPENTQILGYSKAGSCLYVNFSDELVTNHPGGSTGEIMTVYGIVNTLVGMPGIDRVHILVENQQIATVAGHLDVKGPLQKDYAVLGGSLL